MFFGLKAKTMYLLPNLKNACEQKANITIAMKAGKPDTSQYPELHATHPPTLPMLRGDNSNACFSLSEFLWFFFW